MKTPRLAAMQLEAARPFLTARVSTTKNRKDAVTPLHPSLAAELREAQKARKSDADRVFQSPGHSKTSPKRSIAVTQRQ